MKRVLMISYAYPPIAGIGMLRSLKFAKYLPRYGWKPIVLTPRDGTGFAYCNESEGFFDEVEIIRSPYFDIESFILKLFRFNSDTPLSSQVNTKKAPKTMKKFFKGSLPFFSRLVKNWIFFPDAQIGWYPFALKKSLECLRQNNVDLIYSTSSPETSHLIGYSLKRKTGLPWVADFRDPWTQNLVRSSGFSYLRQSLEKILEKKVIRIANGAIAVSEPFAEDFRSYHQVDSNNVFVVTNGYDPDDYDSSPVQAPKKFRITYTGRLTGLKRNPEPLFAALAELGEKGAIDLEKVEIKFYTSEPKEINRLVNKYQLEDIVESKRFVSYYESLRRQQESTILFLLLQRPIVKGLLPGKVFEYLGAKRPILSIPSSGGVLDDILRKTKAGVAISDQLELKTILLRWYREFTETGKVHYFGIESEIAKYTRQEKTRELSEIFDWVTSSQT